MTRFVNDHLVLLYFIADIIQYFSTYESTQSRQFSFCLFQLVFIWMLWLHMLFFYLRYKYLFHHYVETVPAVENE